MMPSQFCKAPGCSVLLPVGRLRCENHAHRDRADCATEVKPWYRSARWSALRLAVLQDEPFCRVCLTLGLRVVAVDVDHIQKHGGDPVLFWDRANLQGLCKSCHTKKTRRGE